jgi:hypothetical protein
VKGQYGSGKVKVEVGRVGGRLARHPHAVLIRLATSRGVMPVMRAPKAGQRLKPGVEARRVHERRELLPGRTECAHGEGGRGGGARTSESDDLGDEPHRPVLGIHEEVQVSRDATIGGVLKQELRPNGERRGEEGGRALDK